MEWSDVPTSGSVLLRPGDSHRLTVRLYPIRFLPTIYPIGPLPLTAHWLLLGRSEEYTAKVRAHLMRAGLCRYEYTLGASFSE